MNFYECKISLYTATSFFFKTGVSSDKYVIVLGGLYLKNDTALQYVIYIQSCEASSFKFDDLENLISSTDFVEL